MRFFIFGYLFLLFALRIAQTGAASDAGASRLDKFRAPPPNGKTSDDQRPEYDDELRSEEWVFSAQRTFILAIASSIWLSLSSSIFFSHPLAPL